MNALELENVYIGNDERFSLSNVSIHMERGELCAVVGENGAGKSTFLDVVSGLCQPHRGRVRLFGKNMDSMSAIQRARQISSLGQNPTTWLEQNVRAYIGQGFVARRGPGKLLDSECHNAIEKIASEFAIQHLLDRSTGRVSGGELRRIQIARCLLDEEADVFVLDEPLSGVDIKHQASVCESLKRRAARGHLVCFSVHDLGYAYDVADRIVALKEGRIVANGPPVQTLTSTKIQETFGVSGAIEKGERGQKSVLRLGPL